MSLNLTEAQEEFLLSLAPPKYGLDEPLGACSAYTEYELQRVSDTFMDEYNIYISTDENFDFYGDFEQAISA